MMTNLHCFVYLCKYRFYYKSSIDDDELQKLQFKKKWGYYKSSIDDDEPIRFRAFERFAVLA